MSSVERIHVAKIGEMLVTKDDLGEGDQSVFILISDTGATTSFPGTMLCIEGVHVRHARLSISVTTKDWILVEGEDYLVQVEK